jgi:hypothetical protein
MTEATAKESTPKPLLERIIIFLGLLWSDLQFLARVLPVLIPVAYWSFASKYWACGNRIDVWHATVEKNKKKQYLAPFNYIELSFSLRRPVETQDTHFFS